MPGRAVRAGLPDRPLGRVAGMKRVLILATCSALFLLGACGDNTELSDAADEARDPVVGTTAPVESGEQPLELTATLSGAAERPGPGDPDGSGTAMVVLDPSVNEVCFKVTAEGIEEATAAHIHTGTADVAGPVALEITAPAGGSSEGCTVAEASLINELSANPAGFYVNVHNAEFPDGAIRGQLAAA